MDSPKVGGVIRGGGVGERSGCVVVLWRKQRCKIRREGEGEDEGEEEEEQWVRRGGGHAQAARACSSLRQSLRKRGQI